MSAPNGSARQPSEFDSLPAGPGPGGGPDESGPRPGSSDARADGRHSPAGPNPAATAHAGTDEASILELLADAERTVALLREELTERQRARARAERTAAQHAEVDRLAEHLANAQVHWGHVRSFLEAAVAELQHQPPDR
ncbi:MAG TPA: hypothetical protein VK063_02895 [Beutenbergiaceae bacterium]|nr:hypothetical protein [Beutenbergiaceae bacterium]